LTNDSFFETQNTLQKTKQNTSKIIHNTLFRELFTPFKNILKKQTVLFVGVEAYLLLKIIIIIIKERGGKHGHPQRREAWATRPPQ
jgi:hypothetical protein